MANAGCCSRRREPSRAAAEETRRSPPPPPRVSLRTVAPNRTSAAATLPAFLISMIVTRTWRTRRIFRPSNYVYAGRRASCRVSHRGRLRLVVEATAVFFLLMSMVGLARAATVEDGVGLRPSWIPLAGGVSAATGGPIEAVFRSGEVLQMYHLQATAELYEQGGLNHDMSFFLTAVAFHSMERPDTKVSMAYHPTNMTISLLPVISEDGSELRWDHQAASASYVEGLDQTYWTAASYMGETTGAFFSYAVEFSVGYHRDNPRYQPFSVYEVYPGHAFLPASSCDEYVWALLSAAQERGVSLTPALMPQKHKIVIYTETEPEVILLDGGGGGGGGGGGSGPASAGGGIIPDGGRGNGSSNGISSGSATEASSSRSSSSSLLPSPSPPPSTPPGGSAGAGEGGGEGGTGDGGSAGGGSDAGGGAGAGGEGKGAGDDVAGIGSGDGGDGDPGGKTGVRRLLRGAPGVAPEVRPPRAARAPETGLIADSGRGGSPGGVGVSVADGDARRGEGGQGLAAALLEGGAESVSALLQHADRVLVTGEIGVGRREVKEADEAGGGGGGEGTGQTLGPGTIQPTVVPTVMPTQAVDPTEPVAENDWQQVVAYYQSLQLCLQERKFSFVTSLKDFAQYFDCLDDVAFIHVAPHEYRKVNLTSTKLDHISLPEELPALTKTRGGFTRVDTLLAIWILLILACGVHGMLWQAALIQHWIKSSGCDQVEDLPPDDPELERHPSLARQVATEYLRLGERFLGKIDDCPSTFFASSSSEAGATPTLSSAGINGDEVVSPRSPPIPDSSGVVDIGKNAPGGRGRRSRVGGGLDGGGGGGGGRKGDGYFRVRAAPEGDDGRHTVPGGEEEQTEEGEARRGRGGGGFGRGRRTVKGDGERYGARGVREEEEGVEMRVAEAWPITSGASEGRDQEGQGEGEGEGEEGENFVGTFVGSARSPRARKAGVPESRRPPPRGSEGREGSPSSSSSPQSASWAVGEARASVLKSRRIRGALGGGGGDRWIGFAGSPRLRTTDNRVHHNFGGSNARAGDVVGGGGGAGSDGPATDLLRTSGSEDDRDLVAGSEAAADGRAGGGEIGGREESKASRDETEGAVSLLPR